MAEPKPYVDVMIIVPLAEELDSLYEVFEYDADFSDDSFQISKLKSPNDGLSVYLTKLKEQGNIAAREACNHILEKFSVGLIVCYGIAGAIKKDVRLADVCVSHKILDLTDQSKLEESNNTTTISHNAKHLEVERSLCTRLAFLCENPAYDLLKKKWEDLCLESLLTFESYFPLEHKIAKKHIREETQVFFGPIVSYLVVASDKFADSILKTHRNALAVETESSGAFEVANRFGTPIITIRGISDYADKGKNKLELDTGDQVRRLAARNAASYLKCQLMSPTITSFLADRKRQVNQDEMRDLFKNGSADSIEKLLIDIEEEIDEQLREKCPAYVHKRKGSILPAPRLQRSSTRNSIEAEDSWDVPQELAHVVENFTRITITLEPTYPDRALPWVIADNILRTNGERLYIPIVVDGETVSPRRFNLARLEKVKRIESVGIDGATPVIIVDDPNVRSNTRSGALVEEASDEAGAKFIVVLKKHSAPFFVERFVKHFESENFTISSFSLDALSTFLSNNFEFDTAQSAVLATKLNETFERFRMRAHPSYFAGISPEILAGLINANRRGELIQLAVEGALMIMVAADDSDVHVSRRWRREYLKDVISRQYIEGEVIDETRAIEIAKDMAEKRDIEISAIEFVHSFVAAGILEFTDAGVQFVLVYVRDYLIAENLHENPTKSTQYFDLDHIDEDFNVLDIYSELGPSPLLVERVIECIENDVAELDEHFECTKGNLETEEMQSAAAGRINMYSAQGTRISKTIEYVGENSADLKKKQQLLDIHRMVSRRANELNRTDEKDGPADKFSEDTGSGEQRAAKENGKDEVTKVEFNTIAARWCAGVCLLATGAERLEVEPKRRLAGGLISLGVRIAEVWTSKIQSVDFDEVEKQVLESEEFRPLLEEAEEEKAIKDLRYFLQMLRFSLLSLPFKVVLHVLCGQGEGNVLRKTIKSTEITNKLEGLTKAVWSSDLDAQNVKEIMAGPLADFEKRYLLNFVLAEHFVNRVYWAKWKVRDKEAFLDVATKILKSLNIPLDEKKIKKSLRRKKA